MFRIIVNFGVEPNSMSMGNFLTTSIRFKRILKIDAENEDTAISEAHNEVLCFCDQNDFKLAQITTKVIKDIMSYYNGHNNDLVDKLNELWLDKKNHNNFGIIISALYVKYQEECDKKDIHFVEQYDKFYDCFVWNFLSNVCDDCDLETIIKFVSHT